MSLEATRRVWKIRGLSAPERLVLLCLADAADAQGIAWPSVGEICERTELGKTAVYTAIRVLRAAGHLSPGWEPGCKTTPAIPPAAFRNTESGGRNPADGIRNPSGGPKIPPRGNEIPPDGNAYKESESTKEATKESTKEEASGLPLWEEFRKRAGRSLGAYKPNLGACMDLPQMHSDLLLRGWSEAQAAGWTNEDLLRVSDWMAAGGLAWHGGAAYGYLAKSLELCLSKAHDWHEAGRPDPRARGQPRPHQTEGLKDGSDFERAFGPRGKGDGPST